MLPLFPSKQRHHVAGIFCEQFRIHCCIADFSWHTARLLAGKFG